MLVTSLLLSACGGSGSKTEDVETNRDVIFKEETNIYPLEEGDISQIMVVGDTLYVEQYIYNYDKVVFLIKTIHLFLLNLLFLFLQHHH